MTPFFTRLRLLFLLDLVGQKSADRYISKKKGFVDIYVRYDRITL